MKTNEIILYTNVNGNVKIEVTYHNDSFWMTQKAMSILFGVEVPAVNKHLANIYDTNELQKDATISKMEIVQKEGTRTVKRQLEYYHLKVVLAVGYRVNSAAATQFRIWATNTLQEYVVKGFVMDDERLKSGKHFGKDYFDEMLERIREIRNSERRFYQKITDIYALSVDYDKDSTVTKDFFAIVQNKLHWAISGKTAAEIIYTAADATKLYMGLKTWKAAPDGKILKSDVTIAKNYLNEEHIKELNKIVSAYLDLAENNAQRGIAFAMENWIKFLDSFLQLSSYPILLNKGKITMLEAKLKVESEYDKYRVIQDKNYESDFDKAIKEMNKKKPQ